MQASKLKNEELQELNNELERLKRKANAGFELKVEWLPDHVKYSRENKRLRGEVLGNTIFVYDSNLRSAKETLKHEFIEYMVEQAIEPYRRLVNSLLTNIERTAYESKEKVVKALSKLLD